ncbi:MAG: ABC transporter permease, partial [Clostridia bacterium]|nr:ABC transporter permease [Clostridia bacterium]
MANSTTKEPLIHITKRGLLPWYGAWGIRGGAILLALIFCALVTTVVTGQNPLSVYVTIFNASFSTQRRTWVLVQNIAMLLSVSLALIPAFKMKFWNLGGEGQMLAGGLATAACMICLKDVFPNWAIILCMIVGSVAAGALWGFIPAFFKARFNTNETLFTLMMNYVATQLVAFFIIIWEVPKGAGKIGIINQQTQIGWLPVIGSYKYLLNVIVVAIICVAMYIYLG